MTEQVRKCSFYLPDTYVRYRQTFLPPLYVSLICETCFMIALSTSFSVSNKERERTLNLAGGQEEMRNNQTTKLKIRFV